ncbi:MAG: hypothetical protein P4L31_06125 [Candidatus Babeliales bacterium]|nr:hypothetical protein [Candidatus Babeliales bacterium]
MNIHNQKLLKTIQGFCKEYLDGKINIPTLESSVEAVHSNLENDIDKKIKDEIFRFIARLDNIYFLHSNEEYFELVKARIQDVNSFIEAAIDEK